LYSPWTRPVSLPHRRCTIPGHPNIHLNMEYTFGGKYKIEEAIATGGCGACSTCWRSLQTLIHPLPRLSLPWFSHNCGERSCYQTPTNRSETQPNSTGEQDLQDSLWLTWYSMDYVVWKAGRLRCNDHRPPRTFSRRLVQNVQQAFFIENCPPHR
jgi:hypothetical protein